MFRSIRNAALLAIVVLPALGASAQAQPYDPGCRRDNRDNTTAGTVVGGVAGAILGSAVAGRHDRAAGAVIGGVGGAVIGHEIAKSNEHPCPAGYYYVAPPPPPPPPPPPRPMPPPPPPPPAPPPPPPRPEYRPAGVHERIDFLQARIDRASQSGRIPYGQAKRLNRELGDIRRQDDQLRYRDGGRLTPPDRDYLINRLDGVSRRLDDMVHDDDHDRGHDHDHDRDGRDRDRDRDERH